MTQIPITYPPPLLEDTPENREMLRQVLWIMRQSFEDTPSVDRDIQVWVRAQHHRIIGKNETKPKRRRKP